MSRFKCSRNPGGMLRMWWWWWLMAAAAAMVGGCEANLIKVGGKQGWGPNVNYTEWAKNKHFYVGDWLYFIFDKHYFTVFEVNETNYERCSEQEFITNITKGGRDVFNLTHPRPYYFLSSGGYCWHGMKLAINVTHMPAPAPSPSKSNAPPSASSPTPIILSIALLCPLLFKFFFHA
ncbi:hypothetical protein AAG906_019794 [Vitis piasezkii]|uniref:Lamin-like protein n=2 Tax=Vitis vinifera TaxID=29760 RepID=D7SXG9_VITVI|eukprot:XP_002278873.3 PREDICTED: lamin-like protein [Vitis vinifera]